MQWNCFGYIIIKSHHTPHLLHCHLAVYWIRFLYLILRLGRTYLEPYFLLVGQAGVVPAHVHHLHSRHHNCHHHTHRHRHHLDQAPAFVATTFKLTWPSWQMIGDVQGLDYPYHLPLLHYRTIITRPKLQRTTLVHYRILPCFNPPTCEVATPLYC